MIFMEDIYGTYDVRENFKDKNSLILIFDREIQVFIF